MRKIIIVLGVFILLICFDLAQGDVIEDSLYSESLGRTMPFMILTPSIYDPANKYPVMYLLHGVPSNYKTWLDRVDIGSFIDRFPMIIVMPEGEASFYVNAYAEPKDRFEDYLINDLPKYIEGKYAVDPENQTIAGFSMGGYGAAVLALRHPDRFKYAVSLSGALSGARRLEELKSRPGLAGLVPTFNRVFGEEPNDFRTAHDPFELYRNTPPEDLPYFILIFGAHDRNENIITDHKEFADALEGYRAYYELHELPGGHDYRRFGHAALNLLLDRLAYLESHDFRSFADLLSRKLESGGLAGMMTWYNRDFKARPDPAYYVDSRELNLMGYALAGEGRYNEAVAVFGIAVDRFPGSANLYDSMSDIYLMMADTVKATMAVKRCVELIGDDPGLSDDEKTELRQIADEKLSEWRGK